MMTLLRGAKDVAATLTTGVTTASVAAMAADTTRCTAENYADFTALFAAKAASRLRAVIRAYGVATAVGRCR